MNRTFVLVGTLALLATIGVACGGGDGDKEGGDSPDAAILRLFDQLDKGQWGRQWEDLHPAHQAVVSRDSFIACASEVQIDLDSVEVLEVYDEPVSVEGASLPSKAVTVRLEAGPSSDEQTFHLLDVEGEWRWVMSDDALTAYRAGECPA